MDIAFCYWLRPDKKLTVAPAASVFKNLFNRYSNALIEKPYKTKILTGALLTIGGDGLCQTLIEKKQLTKDYNYRRTINLILIGALFSTPICHLWYMKGAPAICQAVTNNKKFYPYISMVADQTLISTSTMAIFLFMNEYLRDFNFEDAVYNVKRKFWAGLKTNWKIWPPLILINFLLIPPHFRVFFTNFFGFFWGIYLSWFQFNC